MEKTMNHREYVGLESDYDRMGTWQFNYLTDKKVNKDMRFLDVGCGSLRLGKHLIPWLNENNYIGLDLNGVAIELGISKELSEGILAEKSPQFIVSDSWDMSEIKPVDFAWAQAVFNHINLDTISNCLSQLKNTLKESGVFYFTYWPGEYNALKNDTYTFKKQNVFKTAEQINDVFNKNDFIVEETQDKTLLGQKICRAKIKS